MTAPLGPLERPTIGLSPLRHDSFRSESGGVQAVFGPGRRRDDVECDRNQLGKPSRPIAVPSRALEFLPGPGAELGISASSPASGQEPGRLRLISWNRPNHCFSLARSRLPHMQLKGHPFRSKAILNASWILLGGLASSQVSFAAPAPLQAESTQADETVTQDPVVEDESQQEQQDSQAPATEAVSEAEATQLEESATGGDQPVAPPANYSDLSEVTAQLASWLQRAPDSSQAVVLAPSRGGLVASGVLLGAPGPRPLEERTTIAIIGALDGISLSGAEASLWIGEQLLQRLDELSPDVAFAILPWGAPDGLAARLSGFCIEGRNALSTDDDGDGLMDEDGPDDVDGDGMLMQMLVPDPEGPWVRGRDKRFLMPAGEGDYPRYRLLREGSDNDGDGLLNEDGVGGVVLDRHFPVNWRGRDRVSGAGAWPLAEARARAIADRLLSMRTAIVVVLQGNHGLMAQPGGVPGGLPQLGPAELASYSSLRRLFVSSTGREQALDMSLSDVTGGQRAGTLVDWAHSSVGALAIEVSPWGPDLTRRDSNALDAGFRTPQLTASMPPHWGDQRWIHWLDDVHGGRGFVDWYPVQLDNGVTTLVGGWEPQTCLNPPPAELSLALQGLPDFAVELAAALPRLELILVEQRRDGELCSFSVELINPGLLPTGFSKSAEVELELELPPGAKLLVGSMKVRIGQIPGGATSERSTWVVTLPRAEPAILRAKGAWIAPVELEVRP